MFFLGFFFVKTTNVVDARNNLPNHVSHHLQNHEYGNPYQTRNALLQTVDLDRWKIH